MIKMTYKNIYNEKIEIEMVDKQEDANFITHAGTFHADEVMATVLLLNKFKNIKLYRANKVNNKNAFCYDIGFGKYDHHGINFDLKRENGIKYASVGLIWKDFGMEIIDRLNIIDKVSFFESIDRNLIMDIDRDDNGQKLLNEPEIKTQTIPSLISYFNPSWNEENKDNVSFLNAVYFSNTIFNNMIKKMVSKEEARSIVEDKISNSKENILILDKYMPWKDILFSSSSPKAKEILYVIFPSKRGGYNVVAAPCYLGSFDVKKPFPKSWAGLEDEQLQKVSGINSITFCHKGLFICACNDFKDAIKIANISINS